MGPLTEAARRLPHPPKALAPSKSKVNPDIVIGMKAAGVPMTRIADVLGVNQQRVSHVITHTPGAAEQIALYREKLKVLKIEKAHQLEGRLWARAEREVAKGDAKDVDAMLRALHASEKIQASVAGETQASSVPPNPLVDLKVLIQQVLGT